MFMLRIKTASLAIPASLCIFLAGCGGGGSASSTDTVAGGATYSIGGIVGGMGAGTSVVLSNNGGDNLAVSANGSFTFVTGLATGTNYKVAIVSNPAGQICSLGGSAVGSVALNSITDIAVTCVPSSATVTTLAGTAGAIGSANGTGTAASFNTPTDIAMDAAGNGYVADSSGNTIRKITSNGTVSTLAGTAGVTGAADGSGAAASFYAPSGVAVDTVGNVYITDSGNGTIRKITPDGVVSTLAGTAGVYGATDGIGAAASFYAPAGIGVDAAGNVYVADRGNNTIRKVTPTGTVTTLAGTAGVYGSADGTGAAASFYFPIGIALDASNNIYVGDGLNTLRKITPAGLVTTLAGTAGIIGSADGAGAAASFSGIGGIALDAAGNIYLADQGNNLIRKVTPSGVASTLAGTSGRAGAVDGAGGSASFKIPSSVALDTAGNIYVTDLGNATIRKIMP